MEILNILSILRLSSKTLYFEQLLIPEPFSGFPETNPACGGSNRAYGRTNRACGENNPASGRNYPACACTLFLEAIINQQFHSPQAGKEIENQKSDFSPKRLGDYFPFRVDVQFLINILDMKPNGFDGDGHPVGNHFVTETIH